MRTNVGQVGKLATRGLAACGFALVAVFLSVTDVSAQAAPLSGIFELGTDLGFASFQARAANGSCSGAAHDLYVNALRQARALSASWEEEPLSTLSDCSDGDAVDAARSAIAVLIGKSYPTDPAYQHAYNLGVNLAIAEAQTTAGEPARQIVYISLSNAKPDADALKLDITTLVECISLAEGQSPLQEVHSKLVTLRSVYKASL